MNQPKPIFIIKLGVANIEQEFIGQYLEEIFQKVQQEINDWHIIVSPNYYSDLNSFEAFHVNNIEEKTIEEITNLVKEHLNERNIRNEE